jgi:hypothetical protein
LSENCPHQPDCGERAAKGYSVLEYPFMRWPMLVQLFRAPGLFMHPEADVRAPRAFFEINSCSTNIEYDAAQARGEVAKRTDGTAIRDHVLDKNMVVPPTVTDLGLTSQLVRETRLIRDAQKQHPGQHQHPISG